MKKLSTLSLCLFFISFSFAQTNVDGLLTKLKSIKSDDERVDAILKFNSNTSENNPILDFKNAQKILLFSKENDDQVAESLALAQIGYIS